MGIFNKVEETFESYVHRGFIISTEAAQIVRKEHIDDALELVNSVYPQYYKLIENENSSVLVVTNQNLYDVDRISSVSSYGLVSDDIDSGISYQSIILGDPIKNLISSDLIWILAHEMIHTAQVLSGNLRITLSSGRRSTRKYWKNELMQIVNSDFPELTYSMYDENALPWELEANIFRPKHHIKNVFKRKIKISRKQPDDALTLKYKLCAEIEPE